MVHFFLARSRSRQGEERWHPERRIAAKAAHFLPNTFEFRKGAVAPPLHQSGRQGNGIDRSSACSADGADVQAAVGKQGLYDAPSECAMTASALQGEIDMLTFELRKCAVKLLTEAAFIVRSKRADCHCCASLRKSCVICPYYAIFVC
ncbi:hypothetical protein MnTg02_00605 [bacterium MnTg02]|nr:hypothetical protein MnTg02_00605 [bacterium MnTg02]